MRPFQPANGEARWRKLYKMISNLQPGDGVTYADARECLGEPSLSRKALHAAMKQASERLEAEGGRSMLAKNNYGWVVLSAQQTLAMAGHHHQKSARQIRKGIYRITSVQAHRHELDNPEEADRMQSTLFALDGLNGKRASRRSIIEILSTARMLGQRD